MRRVFAAGIAILLMTGQVLAADTFIAEGVVNAVKSKENKLNITHGPVNGLMAGMTMDFTVLDPSMLNDVKVGNSIRFTLSRDSRGNLLVTDLEPVATISAKK